MTKLKVLSLFAGIGGFDLGLERTNGFETVAFCEQDKKAQAVLRKHWPGVPIYDDVRTLTGGRLAADGVTIDCIVGGFPCQDISNAGLRAGIEGERSGLWTEFARLVGELGPSFVIVENVSALLGRGLGVVLGDLAALGYDAEWHCIPASYVGAPHRRDRIWIVAHPSIVQRNGSNDNAAVSLGIKPLPESGNDGGALPLADPDRKGLEGWQEAGNTGSIGARFQQLLERRADHHGTVWETEPAVGRVADGVPGRVDRLKQLGNAVVPQIPELIGNTILASLAEQREAA